ncbi:pilus assembly protein TadG-related protein [Novosphingobium bradum]|uniref:Pilus assembly protein TadG-related protein n=1 Tax=Novosphingobium bradum TaxID=1737444 RepID=A0ABV7IL39_9SPHN
MVNRARRSFARRSLAHLACRAGSFLGRLRRNTAGNVLALVAAALPPILILVGGGVDMSRAYMAQTSLQNACDAGVLAGRRAQAKSGAWGTTEQAKAQKMFAINYQGAAANATGTSLTLTNPSTGVIAGVATTTVPTTIMKIFGTNTFTLTANCSAEFQVSNIDVMMVLDTTGSMACQTDGTNCSSGSTSKIEGLKSAIRSFYYTIAAAIPSGGTTRVRFGFVPYAGTVNMTNLLASSPADIPSSYIASTATYQSRVGVFDRPIWKGTKTGASTNTDTMKGLTQDECYLYSYNKYPDQTGQNPQQSGTPPSNVSDTSYTPNSWTAATKKNQSVCVRNKTTSTITGSTATRAYTLSTIRYQPETIDTSTIRNRAAVTIASAILPNATVPTTGTYDLVELGAMTGTTGITTTTATWDGCMEERSTVNSLIDPAAIVAGATDLDVASAPSSEATRWKPYFPDLEYDRGQSGNLDSFLDLGTITEYCVPSAQKFTTVDTSAPTTVPTWIETYLGTLTPWGGTYHDIGMIWGARLANPNGIMSANVNSGSVTSISRHIIFLTDGEMSPYCEAFYSAYGIEYLDNRVMTAPTTTGSACDTALKPYHNARYLAACQRAKDMGYTVWVIGFGQAVTTEMTSCAGNGGSAMAATSTSALQTTFRDIASRIANLRLKT